MPVCNFSNSRKDKIPFLNPEILYKFNEEIDKIHFKNILDGAESMLLNFTKNFR